MSIQTHPASGPIGIDGQSLSLAALESVAMDRTTVLLEDMAVHAIQRSRDFVDAMLERGDRIYGVTTGFGRLAEVVIDPDRQTELQRNLVRSHASGMGDLLPEAEVRAMLLLRANALSRGDSGCRVVVVRRLLDLLNHQIHPEVPEQGSVGASGDLAPLAHIALALMGEGRVTVKGETLSAAEAMSAAGIQPLELAEKEGVALINGTQATTGIGALAARRLARAVDTADVAGAMSLEGLMGTPDAFRPEIQDARPHPGQIATARRLWALLADSEIRESHRHGDSRVQDAYSLRCMPQVHGAGREALAFALTILTREANSTTDNPLVLPDANLIVSGGNFHAQIVAQALDLLAIAAADLAAISERRIERLLNPDLSGLPPFLTPAPGLRSGFMIAQVAAVDALAEMRVLAHPASVDSVPTSAAQEDHVSMGMLAARKLRQTVTNLERVLAVELMCAAQAVEMRRPLTAGQGVERALTLVREVLDPLDEDRPLRDDIARTEDLVRSGALSAMEVA